ncbi:Insect cuticle protein [Trinorchestia longiramus]|nr:Insect cuticle protein [Trinorchestia longiramus]
MFSHFDIEPRRANDTMRSIVSCIFLASLALARPEGGHSKSIVHHSGLSGHHDIHQNIGHQLVEHRPLGHDPHQTGFQSIGEGFGQNEIGHHDIGHNDIGHHEVEHHDIGGYEAPSIHGGHHEQHQGLKEHAFEYVVQDPHYGGHFGHTEQRDGYVTKGSYFVDLPDGRRQTVHYTADQYGYHPVVTYEGEAHFDQVHHGSDYQPPHHNLQPEYH